MNNLILFFLKTVLYFIARGKFLKKIKKAYSLISRITLHFLKVYFMYKNILKNFHEAY